MKKRLLACVLSLSLIFNLSVPALAVDDAGYLIDEMEVYPDEMEAYPDDIPADIKVNAEDFILDYGVSGGSLGVALSMGQIAALIAGGVGTVYLASNWDALGSHLQTALNEAASLNGGAAALTYWLENARQGVIALSSAPSWIMQTILNSCYNMHEGLSYPQASHYPNSKYQAYSNGSLLPANTALINGISVNTQTGELTGIAAHRVDVPAYSYRISYYDETARIGYSSSWLVAVDPANSFNYRFTVASNKLGSWYSQLNEDSTLFYPPFGLERLYHANSAKTTLNNTIVRSAWFDYVQAGSLVLDSKEAYDDFDFSDFFVGDAISAPIPVGESVCPDALVGGISQAWTNDTLGADVIDLPDILIDGSGVITGTDTATLDTSISTTLDKVATGELAWDDYWLDISNSVPIAKVEDTTTGDVVNRPIAPDGTLQDPVVVPDYSTDLNDYTLDLKGIFPFCIPFDIYEFLSCLAADPEAPSWTWSLPFGSDSFSFDVDLSPFDEVAQLFRNFELLLFIVGLGLKTRDLIKG